MPRKIYAKALERKSTKPKRKDLLARAFGEGCDARLAGVHVTLCPYEADRGMANAWMEGNVDVENSWCAWAAEKRPLPPAER